MNDISSFAIQNTKQIISHLSLMVKNKCLLSARFGTNNESYITALLGIDEKNNTLILDYGPKEDLNQRILNAGKISFDADYTGIKVSFVGTGLKKITHKGEPAFSMPIPKSLFWMQRREYFRVKSPLSKSSYCQLLMEGNKPVNLKLYDISLTGFAMLNVSKEVSELMIPGEIITQGKLVLADAGEGLVSFEVCAKYIINPDKLQKIQKIGCRFVKLTRPVEEVIQRYMQQIQREDLQKE
ncbi:flagellar brake protein [Methylobacter sp. Wu8]|jgi:c-di-GMP-binding flagellar brake protein YcgR|uniref:Flagellar brake protein YcgR n=1 Tax=Methylobacter tundripaludum TaxID=173365 RepID=A0A2S6GLD4_9GAMM|nr:flagellar brake protein [Methylobacter tundripaludum]MCK9636278.1 flagellar brake protein [Methylobacter tundripaludum]PPK66000.1 c-di-GMP-binding flagellar brake protein YcgR [Methylobacter tundripaludum]